MRKKGFRRREAAGRRKPYGFELLMELRKILSVGAILGRKGAFAHEI
ncbi:hypothetical protein JIR23_17360 [Bradyrhizobium diazoefficiens]|nr:hypothetical protein JIR23_17360 [Bradyrhizobium diazoefficiens]